MVAAATREINGGRPRRQAGGTHGFGIVETNPMGSTFFITVPRIMEPCG